MIGRFAHLGDYKELLQSNDFIKVGLAGVLALVGFIVGEYGATYITISRILILTSVAINGLPIIIAAITGLIEKRVNVDELLSIAIIGCLAGGEFLTAAVVSFIMVFGALIEEVAAESARKSIKALIKFSPKKAIVLARGKERTVSVEEVQVGDILLIKPGEQVPVDAIVIEGSSALDESAITGEAIPVEKTVDDIVFAGTFNQNGVLRARTEKIGQDTTLGKVISLVSEAETHKPESIAFIDRFAKWFTPFILSCALIAWILSGEFDRAIAVLIVGCPCPLILAVPTANVAAIGRAAKAGILVKGGQYIEKAAIADAILFDKTGTLTEGNPTVDQIFPVKGVAEEEVLQLAACVEQNSTHPLAKAVIHAAHHAKISVNEAKNLFTEIGLGVKGNVEGSVIEVGSVYLHGGTGAVPLQLQAPLHAIKKRGATPLIVYKDKKAIGFLSVSDKIREGADLAISSLKRLGLHKIGILSGDHEESVNLAGKSVGIENLWPNLQPEGKLRIITEMQDQGAKIIFVGDGINDAPALAASDVGVAMGAKGTQVALETADIALMSDDISKLPFLITLSRRMLFIIKINIAFGLIFNLIAVLASGGGYLTPIMGAVVHNVGSVLVVLSSASIGLFRENTK